MNGKQLKNSILQWAIQGKLVPQDPNDEPASVLLERIRAEKARLVKEGKIKKDKNESIIYKGDDNSYYEKFPDGKVVCIDEEIPFEIPKGWEWARIKHIGSMQAGKNIASSEISSIVTSTKIYPCFGGNGLRGYVSRCNTIGTYPIIGRQGALCGNVNMASGEIYATEHAVVTDNYNQTDVKWLFWFLTALNLNQYATATAQPGLAVSNIIEVLLPIPPRKEQAAIAQTLDRIEPIINRYDESETNLSKLNNAIKIDLQKSILQEAIQGRLVPQNPDEEPAAKLLERINADKQRLVKEGKLRAKDAVSSIIFKGDDNKYYEQIGSIKMDITDSIPFDYIPNSWVFTRLSTVIKLLSGRDLETSRYNSIGKGIPYITGASNIGESIIVNRWTEYPVTVSHLGDLLITCKGTVGTMAINNIGNIHIARQIMSISPILCNADYIRFVIESQMDSLQKEARSMIPGISREHILGLVFPLPPLNEQARIVNRLKELEALLN